MRHPITDTLNFCALSRRKPNPLSSISKRLFFAAACMSIITCTPRALAADPSDPVLKLLLEKGIISQQELDKVKAEAETIRTNNAALAPMESKWKISSAFKNVELYGDLRL